MARKHRKHWEYRTDLDVTERDRLRDREVRLQDFVRRFSKLGFKLDEEYRGLAFGFNAEHKKTWFDVRFLDHNAKHDWGVVNWSIEGSDNVKHHNNAFDTLGELEAEVERYVEKIENWRAKKR